MSSVSESSETSEKLMVEASEPELDVHDEKERVGVLLGKALSAIFGRYW